MTTTSMPVQAGAVSISRPTIKVAVCDGRNPWEAGYAGVLGEAEVTLEEAVRLALHMLSRHGNVEVTISQLNPDSAVLHYEYHLNLPYQLGASVAVPDLNWYRYEFTAIDLAEGSFNLFGLMIHQFAANNPNLCSMTLYRQIERNKAALRSYEPPAARR